MKAQQVLGEVEQLVLLAVLRLGDGAYAVAIRNEILNRTGVDLARGSIYITLDRLEQRGLVRSRFGDPTPERGGKAKRFFRLTPAARAALRSTRRALLRLWADTALAGGRDD